MGLTGCCAKSCLTIGHRSVLIIITHGCRLVLSASVAQASSEEALPVASRPMQHSRGTASADAEVMTSVEGGVNPYLYSDADCSCNYGHCCRDRCDTCAWSSGVCPACGNNGCCRSMNCEHPCCLAPRHWRRFTRRVLRVPSLYRHLRLCAKNADWICGHIFVGYKHLNPDKLRELGLPLPVRRPVMTWEGLLSRCREAERRAGMRPSGSQELSLIHI